MTPSPTTTTTINPFKNRHVTSSGTAPASPRIGRWLFDGGIRPLTRAIFRDDIETLVQARTAELEREIAALREEIDRRAATETTLERARAEAESAAAAKAAYLAMVCHEIRVPLHGIIGSLDLLRDTPLAPEQTMLVQTVDQGSEWLLRILGDILDYSKIEAGRLTLEPVDFDLVEQLQLAIDLHSETAIRKGVQLIFDVHESVPTRVHGDPLRLRQVVANLVGNAVKFTHDGEVRFQVRSENPPGGQMRIRCEVIDTGIGIPSDVQGALFQPFVQGSATTASRYGGTGLGLAICKRLVELMGGEIGMASAAGAGSTFWFAVDLEPARAPVARPARAAVLAGRHVLIVDDNATNRKLFAQLASAWEMRACTAPSAEVALAYLQDAARAQNPVDIVVLDHDLADTDGPALAQVIRADTSIPQPILTLLIPRNRKPTRTMVAHGITACELKPVHPKRLQAMLVRAIRTAGAAGVPPLNPS